jgi:hypothetical protein
MEVPANDKIIEQYKTINKSIRRQKLWLLIDQPARKTTKAAKPTRPAGE